MLFRFSLCGSLLTAPRAPAPQDRSLEQNRA